MKTKTVIILALALLLAPSAKAERFTAGIISDQTINAIIDATIIVGGGKVAWEIWWRWIDRTPRQQRPATNPEP